MPASSSSQPLGAFCTLVFLSLVFAFGVISFRAGLDATPYETADSQGRTMGFNDPFFAEHYGIIAGNCSAYRTLTYLKPYEFALIGAHLMIVALLLKGAQRKWLIGFGAIQPLLFPWGLPGLLYVAIKALGIFSGSHDDREVFVDMPFIWLMAHPIWLIVCGVIVWRSWRAGSQLDEDE